MRRIFLAGLGFWLVVLTLVGLKSATLARTLGWSDEAPFEPSAADGDPGSPTAPEQPVEPTDAAGSPQPGVTSSGATSGPSTGEPPAVTTGPASSAPPPAPSRTFTGTAVAVRTAQSPTTMSGPCRKCEDYSISVTITVSSGRITATTVAYSRSPGASQSYASSANNKLGRSILTAQTWKLGRVSGATYSGNAWELSVKDAMSKAGLPV